MENFKKKHPILYRALSVMLCLLGITVITVLAATTGRKMDLNFTSSDQSTTTTWDQTTTIDNVDAGAETQYRIYQDPISGYTTDCTESAPCLITRNGENDYEAIITNTAGFKVVQYNANGATGTVPSDQRIDSSGSVANNTLAKTSTSETFTISYNMNGSTGAAPSSQTATKTYTYTANGWDTQPGGDGTHYASLSTITPSAQLTQLYAQFTSSNSTTSITLPAPTPRQNYTFDGWYEEAAGTTYVGTSGDSYTPTQSRTLFAKWTLNGYTVTYNANGGSGAPGDQLKIHDEPLTLSSTTPTKPSTSATWTITYAAGDHGTATGDADNQATTTATTTFSFSNWTSSSDSQTYSAGGTYSVNADTTMTANYTPSTTSTSVTLPTPTGATGYSFAGWYDGSTNVGNAGASYTPTANNKTLTAHWVANTYVITLDNANATTNGSGAVYEQYGDGVYKESSKTNKMSTSANPITVPQRAYTVTYNANLNSGTASTISAPAPQTATYTFNGYYDGSTQMINGTGYITSNFTSTKYSTATTLNAHWTSASVTLANPTRNGYTFEGWYAEPGCTNKISNGGVAYTPTADITMYAKWTAVNYSITYTLNGGTQTSPKTSYTVEDANFTIVNPTRSGWKFKGWSGTDLTGDTNTTVTVARGTYKNLAYTANWLKLNDVEVVNNVTGNTGSRAKNFSYVIRFTNSNYPYASQTVKYSLNNGTEQTATLNANGEYSFTLQSGDSMVFKEIIEGTTYTVTQNSYATEGYTSNKLTDSNTVTTNDIEVTFTNDSVVSVPTGVNTGGIAGIVTLVIGIVIAGVLIVSRKAKKTA